MTRNLLAFAGAAALALCIHAQANATTITFDEFAASNGGGSLTTAYVGQGVTFSGSNAGTWSGIGGGDPGNWGLDGTNGDQFLGFNGGPYGDTATFGAAVTAASLDFSRSEGSADGTITLQAFDGATLVSSATVVLGAINTWSTLSVTAAHITSVAWSGTGADFHPYGVDNFVFGGAANGGVPEPATWALLMVGFGGLGATLRRRRSVASAA